MFNHKIIIILSLLIVSGCSAVMSNIDGTDKVSKTMLKGIDISHYQGDFVAELASNKTLDFVISKATQGLAYVDAKFEGNWKALKQENYIRGAYHFYDASENAQQQALHFINTVGDINAGDITPIVDIEGASLSKLNSNTTKQKIDLIEKGLLQLLADLQLHYGRKPIVYTNYTFAQKYLINTRFSDYPLWLAEYTSENQPEIPNVWKERGFKIWQKSDTYKLDSTELDYDVFYGTPRQLLN